MRPARRRADRATAVSATTRVIVAILVSVLSAAVLSATMIVRQSVSTDSTCETLSKLVLPDTTINAVELVPPGAFKPPTQTNAALVRGLPGFCRIEATLTPSADSQIHIEVWLPASGWNAKLQAVGNGAFSGAINYSALMMAMGRGYAAASTDTGHTGGSASFGLGHPEKVTDFGWRAVHDMAVTAKKIVTAYYHAAPQHSYWNGCSAGGRQAMKEAQRFPDDFDGIIAGAPGLDWTARATQAVRIAHRLESLPEGRLLPEDRERLHRAVLEACDAEDGVKDGLIEDPTRCALDPAALRCGSSNTDSCLTTPQVETAQQIYSSMVNPTTKRPITGLMRGSELGWSDLGWTASARATGLDQFRFLVFRNPKWELSQFQGDVDLARAEEQDANTINALDPNLKPFIDRGGKLIQYHGWNDPQISPGNSTQYYSRVVDALGGRSGVHDAYRLFMVPGMGHCGGGDGPNTFDAMGALEQWVERGRAPDRMLASHSSNGTIDRTRPLCPYPEVATYQGTGRINDATSFVCRAPQRVPAP